MPVARVLLVANKTATDPALLGAVRGRARCSRASFHLVVPATPKGLHRIVDPEVAGIEAAQQRLLAALPVLSEAAWQPVSGHVGDANPLSAVEDALHLRGFDEIILSTLPARLSRWLRLDLPSKIAALGIPLLTVTAGVLPEREPAHLSAMPAPDRFEVAAIWSAPPSLPAARAF